MRRYKEERRRQLAFHMDIIHNQSVNLSFTQIQVGAAGLFTWTLSIINQLTSVVRMRGYKEEQLAFHVDIINNQSVNLFCTHVQVYFHVDIIHNK
jgi:hypothetical protein